MPEELDEEAELFEDGVVDEFEVDSDGESVS